MHTLILLTAFLFSLTATASKVIDLGAEQKVIDKDPKRCAVRINFLSHCCGIDDETRSRLLALAEGDARVEKIYQSNYGLEGETIYCLRISDAKAADAVFVAVEKARDKAGKKENMTRITRTTP